MLAILFGSECPLSHSCLSQCRGCLHRHYSHSGMSLLQASVIAHPGVMGRSSLPGTWLPSWLSAQGCIDML